MLLEDHYSYLMDRKEIITKDKRIDRRFKYNSNFKITSVNCQNCNYRVFGVDTSISGMGFLSEVKFQKNDLIEVVFKYNTISISATLKVRHINLHDKGYFIGGYFIALKNIYRDILKQDLLNCI